MGDLAGLATSKYTTLIAGVGLALYAVTRYATRSWRKLPPGPRGLPIIGNALELRDKQWLKFSEWRKTYGMCREQWKNPRHLVINHLSRRCHLSVCSGPAHSCRQLPQSCQRPPWSARGHLQRPAQVDCSKWHLVERIDGGIRALWWPVSFAANDIWQYTHLAETSSRWRRMRRAAHEGLNKGVADNYYPQQTTEAVLLAHGGLTNPDAWDQHVRRASASMVLSIVYDSPPVYVTTSPYSSWLTTGQISSEKDDRVKRINDFVQRLTNAAYPGAHWVSSLLIASRMDLDCIG